jgi:hypothetical protein
VFISKSVPLHCCCGSSTTHHIAPISQHRFSHNYFPDAKLGGNYDISELLGASSGINLNDLLGSAQVKDLLEGMDYGKLLDELNQKRQTARDETEATGNTVQTQNGESRETKEKPPGEKKIIHEELIDVEKVRQSVRNATARKEEL